MPQDSSLYSACSCCSGSETLTWPGPVALCSLYCGCVSVVEALHKWVSLRKRVETIICTCCFFFFFCFIPFFCSIVLYGLSDRLLVGNKPVFSCGIYSLFLLYIFPCLLWLRL